MTDQLPMLANMTLIWLSPGLPTSREAVANELGSAFEVTNTPDGPPAGTSVAVATVFERPLLERLAAVPGAGALLLLKPPGTATPQDLPFTSGPATVVEAADVPDVVTGIRSMVSGPPALWPGGTAAGDFAWSSPPTSELPSVGAGAGPAASVSASRHRRRNWLATAGVIGAAALAAVLVLATQGGASGSNASAFGPGGAPGGNSAPGSSGGTGSNGSGSSGGSGNSAPGEQFGMPGSGGGNSGDDQDSSSRAQRRAQIQAFEACLQRNGVDLSSLRSSGRPRFDPSDPAMAKAFQACASLLPHRSDRDGDGPHFGGRGDQSPGTNQEQGGGTAVPGRTT